MADVFRLMIPHLGQIAPAFAGIDAGGGALPISRIPAAELFSSFEIGSPEFPHGNEVARTARDIG